MKTLILAITIAALAVAQSVPPGGGKPLRISVDDVTYTSVQQLYIVPGTGITHSMSCASGKCTFTINGVSPSGIQAGTTLPETCAVGDVYLKTDASPNTATLYACLALNTWTQQVGKLAGPASSVDGEVAVYSGTSGFSLKRNTDSGVAKLTSGVLGIVSGAGSDCVKVDGTSGSCGTGVGTSTAHITYPAANCQGGAAATGFSLPTSYFPTPTCISGTNVSTASLSFANNASGASESIQGALPLRGTVTSIDILGKWRTSAITGSVVWQIQTACVADGETSDPSFNSAQTITDAAKGTTLQQNDFALTGLTLTGCSTGETMYFNFLRDATHASDDLADTAELLSVTFTINR